MTPATRQVEVSTASNGRPSGCRAGTPANPRIAGFTKMMYDMTMNVVMPATVSRARVVPFSSKRNQWASCSMVLLQAGDRGGGRDRKTRLAVRAGEPLLAGGRDLQERDALD